MPRKKQNHKKALQESADLSKGQAEEAAICREKHEQTKCAIDEQTAEDVSDSSESSSESEEDDDAVLITPQTEAEVLRTYALIKAKDPRVYAQDTKLYDESLLDDIQTKWIARTTAAAASEPLTLRRIEEARLQKVLKSGDAAALDEDSDYQSQNSDMNAVREKPVTEELDLKRAFKAAFESADDDATIVKKTKKRSKVAPKENEAFHTEQQPFQDEDNDEEEFLCPKQKSESQLEEEEKQYKEFLYKSLAADSSTKQAAHDWFSLKEETPDDDRFLIKYILNRGWIEKADGRSKPEALTANPKFVPVPDEAADEADVERMEEFEFSHNLRYESKDGATIATHARNVLDSVRQTTSDRRKRQREARKARKAAEKEALAQQLRQAKNARKKQRMQQLDAELDAELQEECFKMHFEDVVDGMPTRFRYTSVKPEAFGLRTEEILAADDKQLNAHAPLKTLAPFLPADEEQRLLAKYGAPKRVHKFRGELWKVLAMDGDASAGLHAPPIRNA